MRKHSSQVNREQLSSRSSSRNNASATHTTAMIGRACLGVQPWTSSSYSALVHIVLFVFAAILLVIWSSLRLFT